MPSLEHVIMISEKDFGGAFKFGDVFEAGGRDDFSRLSDMGKEVQMDDPVNIQFTSVSLRHTISMAQNILILGYFRAQLAIPKEPASPTTTLSTMPCPSGIASDTTRRYEITKHSFNVHTNRYMYRVEQKKSC